MSESPTPSNAMRRPQPAAETDAGRDAVPHSGDLTRADVFERHVAAFERAWATGNSPDIAVYLPGLPASADLPPGAAHDERAARDALLRELVMIDLEMGWKRTAHTRGGRAPAGPLLEQYVKRFPELGPLDRLSLELIAEEFRARQRWGDRPGNAEYVARFRHRGQELTRLLDDVRRELGREFAAAPSGSLEHGPATASGDGAGAEAALDYRDFLLRRQIGSGGMCRVYTAVQRGTDRPAAVKILRKQWRDSPHLVQRLLLEAELLGRIHHTGVPELYGTGRLPQGGYFLAMQLIAGRPLAESAAGASLPIDLGVAVAANLADILARVHAARVVHCDVTPRNVLLEDAPTGGCSADADGGYGVRLIDFGFARPTNADGIASGDGALAGTVAFMAPEQINPDRGPITFAADIYALGAVLYWLLTGKTPFSAETTIDLVTRIASDEPAVPLSDVRPEVPPAVSEVGGSCLAKCVGKRPASAAQVAQSLREWLAELV